MGNSEYDELLRDYVKRITGQSDEASLIRDVLFLNDATLRRWTYDYWQTRAPSDDETLQSASNEMETAP